MPQEANMFSESIRFNVDMGSGFSRKSIETSLDHVNLLKEFQIETSDLDSKLSLKGTSVSGGQKQRLSIARALLHNPELIIIDDTTSALDADNEKELWDKMIRKGEERMIVLATHRSATTKMATSIIELNMGVSTKIDRGLGKPIETSITT